MLALILNPHRGLYLINCSRMKKNSLKEIITWRQWSWWLKLDSSQRVLQSTVWTKIKENSNENKRGKKLSCVWCVLTWSGRDFFSPLCSLLWSSAAALLWLFFLPSLVISLSLCLSFALSFLLFSEKPKSAVICRSPVWLKLTPVSSFIPQSQPLRSLLHSHLSRPQYRLSVRKDRVSRLEFGPWGLSRVMTYALTTEHFST